MAENGGAGIERFRRNLTVMVEMQGGEKLTTMEVLRAVKKDCGTVVGCRARDAGRLEITMETEDGRMRLMDGIKVRNVRILGKEMNDNEMVVSFLNLPVYIEDGLILDRLREWGVSAVSDIKRRRWPGTDVADGTRFMKVKFTDEVRSLPYSTRFNTIEGVEHFRVLHDRQERVCRLCIKPGHIYRECPELKCFKCGERGHYARECRRTEEEEEVAEVQTEDERDGRGEDPAKTDGADGATEPKDGEAEGLVAGAEEESQLEGIREEMTEAAEELTRQEEMVVGGGQVSGASRLAEEGGETGEAAEGRRDDGHDLDVEEMEEGKPTGEKRKAETLKNGGASEGMRKKL
ncbi:hypothetical protein F2P81_025532 [Scophthalmus maximus]|uniref:CCHC-type domain-containing protein n=1 Tax=Scophthalmus maximus TaxID=52904 RepID=A0A6A4RPV8_SCOMX|nr:hypothetical protein F2P81_025532 [Scophthalmus maximus]